MHRAVSVSSFVGYFTCDNGEWYRGEGEGGGNNSIEVLLANIVRVQQDHISDVTKHTPNL